MAINVTHNVPIINGKKPNSALKGLQLLELNILHKECSCRIGADFRYKPTPIRIASNNEDIVNPNMTFRARISFTILYFV